jgi:hypothetical protein
MALCPTLACGGLGASKLATSINYRMLSGAVAFKIPPSSDVYDDWLEHSCAAGRFGIQLFWLLNPIDE